MYKVGKCVYLSIIRIRIITDSFFILYIGFTATFYITTLEADGLYLMSEIGTITIPSAISGPAKYLIDLDVVINVLRVHENYCKETIEEECTFAGRKRSSSDASINYQLSPTRDCHRQSIT